MKTFLDRVSWRTLFIMFGALIVIRILLEFV